MKTFVVQSLRRSAVVSVDDEDWEKISSFTFYIKPRGEIFTKSPGFEISLGVFLLGRKEGFQVDHINRDKNDNRRSNLRHVTIYGNAQNHGLQKNNTTGYRGVVRKGKYFDVCLQAFGKKYHRYGYLNAEDAARSYNELVIMHNVKVPLNEIR